MSQKSKTELQLSIDALTPLVTLADLKSILTDFNDSFTAGVSFFLYEIDTNLTEGDNKLEHGLSIVVLDLIVFDTVEKVRYKPDFINIDENSINIIWVGDTLSSPEIYFYAKLE